MRLLGQSYFFTWINSTSIDEKWINAEFYRPEIIEIEDEFEKNKNLRIFKLNQIADVNRVTGFEVEKYLKIVEEGIPYLRVKNIDVCYINFEDMQFIPKEVHEKFNKSQFKVNDIALTITGRVGTAAIISGNTKFNACQDVVKISIKKIANVNPYYLVVYLNTKYNYRLLNRFNSGGSRPRTLINNVREVNIPIPSPEIQKYIGDKVRKAEELREEAKRLKKEAEEILNDELEFKTLEEKLNKCKEKFLWIKPKDFDNRMDGEFYKIDFIINNEHIDILKNKGVQVLDLKDIINKGSYGILPSSDDYGKGEVVLLRSTNIKEFLIDNSEVIKVPNVYYKEKVQVNQGDILLEIKGQCYSGAIATELKEKTIVNGSIYKFSVKKGYDNHYVLAYLLSKSGQLQKQQNLANSIISYLSLECINNLKVPIISSGKQKLIGEKYRTYVEQINKSKQLIQEAKNDVGDLIEGNFSMKE